MSQRVVAAAIAALTVLSTGACRSVFRAGSPGSAYEMPPDARRALDLAENLAAGGDTPNALRVVEPFLSVVPVIVPIHRLFQDLSLRTGARDAVVERYRGGLAASESARTLLLLARALPAGPEADALVERAAVLAPADPWVHFARGYRERSNGRLDAAAASFSRALDLDPEFPDALLEAGETAYLLHDEYAATEIFERLRALRPDDRAAASKLAAVLAERQEFSRAEEVLRSYLERRPRDGVVEIALSAVLIDSGRFEEASALLEDLSARFPADATVAYNRAVVAEVHERDYAKALSLYEQYLALGGDDTLRVARWMEKIRSGDVRPPR